MGLKESAVHTVHEGSYMNISSAWTSWADNRGRQGGVRARGGPHVRQSGDTGSGAALVALVDNVQAAEKEDGVSNHSDSLTVTLGSSKPALAWHVPVLV